MITRRIIRIIKRNPRWQLRIGGAGMLLAALAMSLADSMPLVALVLGVPLAMGGMALVQRAVDAPYRRAEIERDLDLG